jgi:uncharacterized protein YjbK
MPRQEIEIKLDLQNEENYLRLLKLFPRKSKEVTQKNYFFDTADRDLLRAGWAVRIRLENSVAEVAAKGPAEDLTESLAVRTEIVEYISREKAEDLTRSGLKGDKMGGEIAEVIRRFAGEKPLKTTLQFINYRIDVDYKKSDRIYIFEIDRTVFSDGSTEYELELELESKEDYSEAMETIKEILKRAEITAVSQKKSKFARAVEKAAKEIFDK